MLPQRSHITRKRGIYYYRRRFPVALRAREMTLSLRTRWFREAEHLGFLLDGAFDRAVAEPPSDPAVVRRVLRGYLRDLLESQRREILDTPWGKAVWSPHWKKEGFSSPQEADIDLCGIHREVAEEALAERDYDDAKEAVGELIVDNGLNEGDRNALSFGVLQARIKLADHAIRMLRGSVVDDWLDKPEQIKPSSAAPGERRQATTNEIGGPPLSELLPDFIDHMVNASGWTGQTTAQSSSTYRTLIEVCGDRPIQAYRRRDLGELYDTLRWLPAAYSKDPRWRGLPLREAVERARDHTGDRLSMKTVKRHFSALGRLFDHYRRVGGYEGDNPAHGFAFPTKGRARDKRQAWSGDKLTALFSSPV